MSNEVDTEIKTLETLNNYYSPDSVQSVAVEEVKVINNPVERVEDKLGDFIQNIFSSTKEDVNYTDAVWAEVINRLPNLSDAALLNLLNNAYQNQSDRISKIEAPLVQLMTAKQQAIIAEQGRRQAREDRSSTTINIGSGLSNEALKTQNETAPQQVIQGLNNVYQLLMAYKTTKDKADEEDTKKAKEAEDALKNNL